MSADYSQLNETQLTQLLIVGEMAALHKTQEDDAIRKAAIQWYCSKKELTFAESTVTLAGTQYTLKKLHEEREAMYLQLESVAKTPLTPLSNVPYRAIIAFAVVAALLSVSVIVMHLASAGHIPLGVTTVNFGSETTSLVAMFSCFANAIIAAVTLHAYQQQHRLQAVNETIKQRDADNMATNKENVKLFAKNAYGAQKLKLSNVLEESLGSMRTQLETAQDNLGDAKASNEALQLELQNILSAAEQKGGEQKLHITTDQSEALLFDLKEFNKLDHPPLNIALNNRIRLYFDIKLDEPSQKPQEKKMVSFSKAQVDKGSLRFGDRTPEGEMLEQIVKYYQRIYNDQLTVIKPKNGAEMTPL